MDRDEVMQDWPLCDEPLVRRDTKPGIARIGGMTPEAQGLPPFWWYCRKYNEYFNGVMVMRKGALTISKKETKQMRTR